MQFHRGQRSAVSLLVVFLFFAYAGVSSAAMQKKPLADRAETFKEWAAKMGYDWGSEYWPTKPVRGGTFQTAEPMYIGLMNPNHWPVNDWVTIGYFYDKLVYTDGRYRDTVPWLAESWTFPDDVTCIMKLRRGVKFHDGSDFNAESVKYQMEWIQDPANGAWSRAWLEPLASIEVMDAYTVKWRFKRPWAGFLGIMSNVPGYMMSAKALKADAALRDLKKLTRQLDREKKKAEKAEKELAGASGEAVQKAKDKAGKARKALAVIEEKHKATAALADGAKEFDNNPVGTGPFMFEEGSPGNHLTLKRNPNWWFAKWSGMDMPYFDRMRVSVIPDPSIRLANLRAGKINSVAIDPAQYPMIKNDRNLQVYVYPINHQYGLRFNHKTGPCKEIRVRKAVAHAIDRKALIAGVAFGLGRPASVMYPDDHWCHNHNLKPVSYDPALSKKLLAEAGYGNGLTLRGFTLNTPDAQTSAEAIKAMLAKVGIDWKVELLESAAISEKLRNIDYELAANNWTWIYDPDLMATGHYHPDGGFNYGRYNNPKVTALIEVGRREMNVAKRTKIYQEIEKILYDNYDDVFTMYPLTVTVFDKKVQGWNNQMYLKDREGYYCSHPLWFKNGR